MIRNLPFTSLRAFETVVRRRGFGRAADELNVTQSSISQHVKALEEWTSCTLLVRGKSGSTPTRDGQMLADAIVKGLGHVSDVCAELQSKNKPDKPIIVSCLPGFAVNWLFPRLFRFDQSHASLPVSISTEDHHIDFVSGSEDLAIRYGSGNFSEHYEKLLLDERITPVCAPSLLESGPPLKSVADLAHHTILLDDMSHIRGEPPTWDYWAKQLGLDMPKPAMTLQFGQSNMVVQAAIEGYGVALGREPLVMDAINDGRLVCPLPHIAKSSMAYWFLCPKAALRSPRIKIFHDWIFEEAAKQKSFGA